MQEEWDYEMKVACMLLKFNIRMNETFIVAVKNAIKYLTVSNLLRLSISRCGMLFTYSGLYFGIQV